MTTILVTGATGHIGKALCDELQRRQVPFRAAVRDAARGRELLGAATACVRLDFLDPDSWRAAFHGIDRLFLVRPPELGNVRRDLLPAVNAALAAGVERVVFLSVLGADWNSLVPHHRVERHLTAQGGRHTLLRPSFFMQNLGSQHRAEIRDHDVIAVPAGAGRTSFIDGRDIAQVAALALLDDAHGGKAYDLTGGAALTYDEVAAALSEVLGRTIRYTRPSALGFWRRWRGLGHGRAHSAVVSAIYLSARFGQADRITDDVARLLGRPPTTLVQYLRDHRELWSR